MNPRRRLKELTPEEFVWQALDARPYGVSMPPTAGQQRPNVNGRKSALQAELSHYR